MNTTPTGLAPLQSHVKFEISQLRSPDEPGELVTRILAWHIRDQQHEEVMNTFMPGTLAVERLAHSKSLRGRVRDAMFDATAIDELSGALLQNNGEISELVFALSDKDGENIISTGTNNLDGTDSGVTTKVITARVRDALNFPVLKTIYRELASL